MARVGISPSEAVFVGLVILGAGMLGPGIAGGVADDTTDRVPETTSTMTDNNSNVGIDVDCNESNVEVTAPEGYQYDLTVGVANVTATSSSVSRSTRGPVAGNATVDVDEEGIVFAVVQSRSDGEITASAVTDCTDAGEATTATTTAVSPNATTAETEPGIEIDCEASEVRFLASEDTEYVAKVSVVSLSATESSSSSATRTVAGNETVSVDGGGLVAAFASTGDLGGDGTVSVIRNCSALGGDGNETDATTTASGTATEN